MTTPKHPANNSYGPQSVPDDALFCHMFGDAPRKADRFPPLEPQEDDVDPSAVVALVVMFAATFAVVVLMVVGMWVLGVQP